MKADERDFLTASEAAAEISATHDVHVDCAHAAVEQIAKWRGVDADRLVPMRPGEPAPPVVNVTVTGSVLSERELAETIQRHLRRPPGSPPVGL